MVNLTNTKNFLILYLMEEYKLEDLEWRCQECDASAPPTGYDYMKLLKHKKGHHIRLVNKKTGEILATTAQQARNKGIDLPRKSDGATPEPGKVGGELATVLQPSKGAIVFTLGEHKISLNPQYLYDAYLYYQDIVVKEDINEEFSLVIRDCVKSAWERLNHHRAEKQGATITLEEK